MASTGTAPARVSTPAGSVGQQAVAGARVRASARWFYWIAGLSLINSAVVIFGGNFHFVVGLGITSVVDAIGKQLGGLGTVLDLIINGTVAGVFFLFGTFAAKSHKWAFLVGMVLYGLDGLLLLAAKDILSVGFHAYVLFALSRGLMAVDQA